MGLKIIVYARKYRDFINKSNHAISPSPTHSGAVSD